MKRKTLTNWLCLSGIISLIVYILHTVIGGMHYPGYDWKSQAVSDLTATNAPSFLIANGLSSVHHLFAGLCVVMVCLVMQRKGNKMLRLGIYIFAVMIWVSAIGYTLFPLSDAGYAGTFQDIMHVYVVTITVVLLSIVSITLIILGGMKDQRAYQSLSLWAGITLLFMVAGPIGMAFVPIEYFGVVERFSVYSVVVFTAILGLYGFAFFDGMEENSQRSAEAL